MADLISMLAAAAGAAAGGGEVDPDFNQTVLLLHGDGTNGAQNNTFLDSSTNNFTITRTGNTTQGTFSPFSVAAGQFSNFFDGTGDFLTVADNAAWDFGSGDFCVETWVYIAGDSAANGAGTKQAWIIGTESNTSPVDNSDGWMVLIQGDASTTGTGITFLRRIGGGSPTSVTYTATITKNAWHHIAVTRESSSLRIFFNGSVVASDLSFSGNVNSSGVPLKIATRGTISTFESYLNGYLSNMRVVKGSAVYTSAFTPSTSFLTAISGTELLTCQSNRFVDNSTNNFAITRNGDVKVTPFSPFAPTAAYDASVNGGSGYFDGTGDTVRTTTTQMLPATDTFTIEGWFYPTNPTGNDIVFSQANNAVPQGNRIYFYFNDTGKVFLGLNDPFSPTLTSTNNYQLNAWNHWAVTRSGSTYTVYLNGVSEGTASSANSLVNNVLVIGGAITLNGQESNGYISDVRLNLELVYTGAYTIPSAPLTATANTKLLLNFTNAGIFDNTGKNNLETVGNAQIDTTTKKYGTGSMEFDGTGDWLLMPHSPDQQLGTGDFTIEFWVYLATGDTGSNRGLVAKGTSTTGFLVSLNTTQKVVFTFTTSTITSTGAITLDAWNHIAVVREGTGSNETKIYIAGTNDGTGTVSTNFNQTSVMYVGANRTGGDPMKGYIDDLRITKGVARYTAAFTPPTAAFPDL